MGKGLPWRINLLWVLAALLGTAAVHAAIRAVHYPEPSRELMGHFAGVTAGFAASVAEGRLQALAGEAFSCRCGRSLPISEFFRVDPASGTVSQRTPVAGGPLLHLPDSLRAIDSTRRVNGESLRLYFATDKAGAASHAVLISSQYDSAGRAVAGYGLVTGARELAARLFQSDTAGNIAMDAMRTPHQSLEVATASGEALFKTPGTPKPYHATIRPRGVLADLSITAGLDPPTEMLASLRSLSGDQLWLSGLLGMSTVLIVVLAAASSRREALLARARSDFIAGVSHELRMPLAQIMLASETLAEDREPDDKARLGLASSIVREARRLATLVDNVLLVARSGAVALRPTLTAVDVESLFADVVESVELAVEDAGRRLEVRAPPGLAVLGDRQLLRQALTNLIDNACKYGGAGQTIRLGADEAKDGVHLYLENDGPGIPAAERERLFEPYQRLSRDQTSERTGAGLGLAVVAQIAKACGGKVWLEDARPSGTRAVLALRKAPPGQPS